MIIKNNTAKRGPKVLFFGEYKLMPDEEKEIPDELLYMREYDNNGRYTGKKSLLPSIKSQVRLGLITVQEKPEKAKLAKVEEPVKPVEEPAVVEEPVAEPPVVEEPAVEEAPEPESQDSVDDQKIQKNIERNSDNE